MIVYAPSLAGDAARSLSVIHAMERACPGLRLEWQVSDEGQLLPVGPHDAWVAKGRADGPGFSMLCNGDEHQPITIAGWDRPAGVPAGRQPQFEVHAALPLDKEGGVDAERVLESIADAAHAFWGHATPFLSGLDIARQTRNGRTDSAAPPRGLPALRPPRDIHSPEIPHRLGWVNFWSEATVHALGFPDPFRDAELLSRSRRTARGGWIVRLSSNPLDLDDSVHLDALVRTYERFPWIGGRSSP